MPILSKGNTFADGDQVTSTKLNNLVDNATFVSGSSGTTDDATLEVNGSGRLQVKTIQTGNIANNAVITAKIADNQVTLAKLAPDVLPSGAIMPFAMNSAPSGWLVADGTEYSKTGTYAALFAAIGTMYGETNGSGGAGTSHFRVPDLRGYFVRGSGTNSDGTASGTFGVKQADEFKAHTHTVDNIVLVPGYPSSGGGQVGRSQANSGSTGGTETRPKNIAMLYCIKT